MPSPSRLHRQLQRIRQLPLEDARQALRWTNNEMLEKAPRNYPGRFTLIAKANDSTRVS